MSKTDESGNSGRRTLLRDMGSAQEARLGVSLEALEKGTVASQESLQGRKGQRWGGARPREALRVEGLGQSCESLTAVPSI